MMKVSDSPYLSPVMRYDPEAHVVVVQRRKPDTGEVSSQVPSEQAVKRAREAPAAEAPPPAAEPETSRAVPGAAAADHAEAAGRHAHGSVSVIA